SSRHRCSRGRQHLHCDSCYSRRCRTRVEASVSCALVPCGLLCGAVFHLCKEEEHLLLCPNVRVPCLNADHGCPLQMPRSCRAAHLQECPASVVCCSMDWLRWPVDETNPHGNVALQENVQKEHEGQQEALDLAMARVDQCELYQRLEMEPLYPELMEEQEEEEKTGPRETVVSCVSTGSSSCRSYVEETVQPRHQVVIDKDKFNLFEMMFSMDRRACEVAQENLERSKSEETVRTERRDDAQDAGRSEVREKGVDHQETDDKTLRPPEPQPDTSKTGQAPWQEGVMERLKEELTPQEYNMYVVHHGRMLMAFGQIQACTPREKDFVYGSLEPIPVQTLRSFKVPDSYHYRRRVHLYDTAARAPREPRGVDTSDLGSSEDLWFSEEDTSTLLGYAEREVMGHKISESKAADGLYVDVGTQTHRFHSAPLSRRTTLAQVMEVKPQRLLLQLQTESVTGRHSRATCVFSFLCGHTFHRREFATHFRNVHGEIQTCLSGWFEQRCPLSYLGCTYSRRRFQPASHRASVYYDFNLRPTLGAPSGDDFRRNLFDSSTNQREQGAGVEGAGGGADSLSSLPYEVLCHVASFLDSLSLSQLALVSRLLRQVCSSLLQDRGMVTLHWEKDTSSHGGAKRWRSRPVWRFSHLFSSVDSWRTSDVPPMSAHLKVCPFYQTSEEQQQSRRVPLPGMSEKLRSSQKGATLVDLLTRNRQHQ
uniref:F-box protein 40 n=1 Tax=Cynoglossus semilaevis TaxID=244447 RepID=A0A3P8VE97_CYNSE